MIDDGQDIDTREHEKTNMNHVFCLVKAVLAMVDGPLKWWKVTPYQVR